MAKSTRSLLIFGAASLAAIAAGCVAMAESGIAPSSWLRTVVAWVVGAVLAAVLVRYPQPRNASTGAVIAATAALIATLFAAGIDGVRRWLDIGPLHINAAALVLPALIVGLAAIGLSRPIGIVSALIVAGVLLAQPDASQLMAFAIAVCILLMRSRVRTSVRVLAILGTTLFVIAGWMRPDPTQPVPEVEQIFAMCAAVSPFLAAIAGLALTAAALAPLSASNDAALPLTAYFVAVSVAPLLGWFPVPLVGSGMSFPIGWWLGFSLLLMIGRGEGNS